MPHHPVLEARTISPWRLIVTLAPFSGLVPRLLGVQRVLGIHPPSSCIRLPGVPGSGPPSYPPSFPSLALPGTSYSSLASMSVFVCEAKVESHVFFPRHFPLVSSYPHRPLPEASRWRMFFCRSSNSACSCSSPATSLCDCLFQDSCLRRQP